MEEQQNLLSLVAEQQEHTGECDLILKSLVDIHFTYAFMCFELAGKIYFSCCLANH